MGLQSRSVVVFCEPLEGRALLAGIAYPSAQEQLLVEMINRGRADPAAEAARYGIDLNEGVDPGETIYESPKQPLAINLNLTYAAKEHSFWMVDNDEFSHTGEGGKTYHQRMTASGYPFTGTWTSGENIAYRGSTKSVDATAFTAQLHADLFIDKNYPNRGHRVNQMNGKYREIGAGVFQGVFTSGASNFNAVMATEDFASSGTNVFLTGVAYTDAKVNDDFYTVGEGVGAYTITAVRSGDNATFSTMTWESGGYSLALPPGTYTVSGGNGNTLGGPVTHNSVVIGADNVKRDFRPDMVGEPFATLTNGHLEVNGTEGREDVTLTQSAGTLTVARNGAVQQFSASSVTSIAVFLWGDNDTLVVGDGVMGLYCDGGMGNDKLFGGQYNDILTGNGNHDTIHGGLGDDRMNGSGGHDKMFGDAGRDRMHGGAGYDVLDGGAHIDRLFPESGQDTCYGQQGDDLMYSLDGEVDHLFGGSGNDSADRDDELELLASVENAY
ncbi:MAG: CAP domain-containing protein [Planctomycetota bacterium]|nr:CAP domain-containing protein [Planctomycetota bacterium]